MKKTAFYDIHQRLGGKIVEFAGYAMPVQYSSIIEEHKCVRSAVGVFDVSHMGEFEIRGRDALALVQKVTANDAAKLSRGEAQYSAMCYPDGGIVDDLLVYSFDDHYMMVVNAANLSKDFEWIVSNKGSMQVDVIDKSDSISMLAVQGPKSLEVLQKLTAVELKEIPFYSFVTGKLGGVEMVISRTGYTGELGFELYFDSDVPASETIWNAVMEAGKEFGIKPVGLGARDSLRLEMGYCLYGNDIDKTTNPLEAGLGWITKLDKGEFIGRDVLLGVKAKGLGRKLVGFTISGERAFPRHGYPIQSESKVVGNVTSGTLSPILEKGIGLGYVPARSSRPGSFIDVLIRNKSIKAEITKLPFIKK